LLERWSARVTNSLLGPAVHGSRATTPASTKAARAAWVHPPEDEEQPPVSADEPDWSRERCGPFAWLPGRQVLRAMRRYQSLERRSGPGAFLARKFAVIRHRVWSLIAGVDIPLNSSIGGGCLILHPNGIVVHPRARIGPNSLLFQQVTIGTGSTPGYPVLGGHVEVGAGAKILGGITIGDHVTIGANAVVLKDVPSGSFVAGVPAVIKR
jgi:serine O-acetyltransferase